MAEAAGMLHVIEDDKLWDLMARAEVQMSLRMVIPSPSRRGGGRGAENLLQ
jgi:hypothetical protein